MIGFTTPASRGINLIGKRSNCLKACPVSRRAIVVDRAFIAEKCPGGQGGKAAQAGISVTPARRSASTVTATTPSRQLTSIEFEDLTGQKDLTVGIEKALGPGGLGAVVIRNVPMYSSLRQRLLPLAERFASLPYEVKQKYVDADSYYSFGWSHGKESLASGVLDTLKGSFYANPLVDDQLRPCSSDWLQPWAFPPIVGVPAKDQLTQRAAPSTAGGQRRVAAVAIDRVWNLREDEVMQLRNLYPGYFHTNLWPRDELPELETAFKDLGRLICAVGCLLAEHCDRYVSARLGTPPGQISSVLYRSLNPKARLLHYFAPSIPAAHGDMGPEQQQQLGSSAAGPPAAAGRDAEQQQAWCGLHTDHGSLTGLTAAMYLDAQGREVPSPDPDAGLYIRDRSGRFIRADIPSDCIAFQVGEVVQVHSGGLLVATPHYVRAPRRELAGGVNRNTFAVFMQPDVMERMDCPAGVDPGLVAVGRWKPGCTFGEFAEATFGQYYTKPR